MKNIPNMPSGKMFPEHSAPTKAKTSEPSWRNWYESKKLAFQSLDLTKANGQNAVSGDTEYYCNYMKMYHPPEFYCAAGELRINNDTTD